MVEEFQNVWEEARREGKLTSKYPYDSIVTFIFIYKYKIK